MTTMKVKAALEHLKTAKYLTNNRSAWQFYDPIEYYVTAGLEEALTDAQKGGGDE